MSDCYAIKLDSYFSQNPFLQLFIRHYKNCPDGFNYLPKRKLGTKYWRMRIFAEKRRFICCTCPCPKFGIGFWMAIIGLLKVKSLNLRLGIGSLFRLWSTKKNSELIWILKKWYFVTKIVLTYCEKKFVLSWPWPWD